MINYYEILNIKPSASFDEILESYEVLKKSINVKDEQDKNLLSEVYNTLSDKSKRKEYDERLLNNLIQENDKKLQSLKSKTKFSIKNEFKDSYREIDFGETIALIIAVIISIYILNGIDTCNENKRLKEEKELKALTDSLNCRGNIMIEFDNYISNLSINDSLLMHFNILAYDQIYHTIRLIEHEFNSENPDTAEIKHQNQRNTSLLRDLDMYNLRDSLRKQPQKELLYPHLCKYFNLLDEVDNNCKGFYNLDEERIAKSIKISETRNQLKELRCK